MASYWFEPETVSLEIGGRELTFETGRLAKQAAGAVVVTYGDTSVLVTAARAKPREGIDFFPLVVDFVEKTSAAGKIPGGFFKREGRLVRPRGAGVALHRSLDPAALRRTATTTRRR